MPKVIELTDRYRIVDHERPGGLHFEVRKQDALGGDAWVDCVKARNMEAVVPYGLLLAMAGELLHVRRLAKRVEAGDSERSEVREKAQAAAAGGRARPMTIRRIGGL